MSAIFKREFKAYFQSVIGWLFIAAILCIYGLYFYVYNLLNGYPQISYTMSAVTFIFLIAVPILTMRALAEEKKNKTDQMILTAPVSVEKVVCAKYLAMAAVYTIVIAVIAATPLILRALGTVPMAQNYVGVLGFWLYGLTCIAIGLFISSLTESQVIAAVLTFAALFLGFMMSAITNLISSTGNLITKILSCYDLMSPLDNFLAGILDISGIIYYLTMIILMQFLTVQAIQKRRWSMSSKKIKLGVFNSGMVVAGIALVVVVNMVVGSLPETITSIDATSTKLYTITDDTLAVLDALDEDVTIYALVSEKSADDTVAKTLDRYDSASSHISVVYKDPSVYPNFYTNYTEDSVTAGSLIVESEKRSKVVDYNSLFETSVDYNTYTQQTTGYDGEGQITSAIQYVTSDDMPVFYELEGHDETALAGDFTDAIEKANITLTKINLLQYDTVPEDAAAIIINGPTSDFSEDDAKKVTDYLAAGGKAFIATNYTDKDMTNFNSILTAYGLNVADGMIIEADSNHYYQQPYYLLPNIESATLTSSVTGNYVFVPYAQGLTYPTDSEDESITYTPLLSTSDSAFSKTDIANMTSYDKEDGDVDGPFTIGIDVVKTNEDDTTTELTVFTSSTMFADDANQVVSGKNSALFSDVMTNLSGGSDSDTAVIPVKEYDSSTLTVPASVTLLGALLGIVVMPLALLIVGIVIWAKRRRK